MVFVAALALATVACGGGGTTIRATSQSCGQELTDLKSAYEGGAISKKEYDRLRSAAIKRCQKTR
jgi:hypothetical protein